ncbi:MAG: hypothetical protein R3Y27_00585 [Clostridia bacterium]
MKKTQGKTQKNIKPFIVISVVVICAVVLMIYCDSTKTVPVVYINGTTQEHNNPTEDLDEIITIEIPLDFIEDEFQDNLALFANEYGYENAELTSSGDMVEVELNKFSHELLLTEKGIEVIQGVFTTFSDGGYDFASSLLEYYEDFTRIVIGVYASECEDEVYYETLAKEIAVLSMTYQLYDEDPALSSEIVLRDIDTSEDVYEVIYTYEQLMGS